MNSLWKNLKDQNDPLQLPAYAKINWSLDVVGIRADGYHLLDGCMQSLVLHDDLFFSRSDALSLTIDGRPDLSNQDDNLILKAAKRLQAYGNVSQGAAIHLVKRIPMGAGLGGGSADAAAALKGLCQLWNVSLSKDELLRLGVRLGADVPFCIIQSPCRAQGIGEILTPFSCKRTYPIILLQPCLALSTKDIFTACDQRIPKHPNTDSVLIALQDDNMELLRQSAGNVLEQASIPRCPAIQEAKDALYHAGASFAQMTGSGSVVFGVFDTDDQAQAAHEQLKNSFPVCILTKTMNPLH